jgi:hypothetical protein
LGSRAAPGFLREFSPASERFIAQSAIPVKGTSIP